MRHPPQFPPEYARGATCVHSRRALRCARDHRSWFGIHQVLDRQPEAPAVAKEPQGKHDEKWHPDRELPPAGRSDQADRTKKPPTAVTELTAQLMWMGPTK